MTFFLKFQANHEEDVKQRTAAEGVQAVSVAKSELVSEDTKGESEMRGKSEQAETVVIRKLVSWADFLAHLVDSSIVFLYLNKTCCGLWRITLQLCCIIVFSDTITMLSIKQSVTELDIFQPKSTTSSESGGSGKRRVNAVPKKSKDKSMLNNFKDFLHSKLKKHERKAGDDVFHGFSDEEIRSASANDSSSERSSIISSLSREEKDERKKRKSEAAAAAAAARASSGMSGEPSVPLLHQSLIVEGKRPKKPSAKIQELAQVIYFLNMKLHLNCFRIERLEANHLTASRKRRQSSARKQMV